MDYSKIIEKMKNIFQEAEIKMVESELEDGTIVKYEVLEIGEKIYVIVEEEEMSLPDGVYQIEGKDVGVEDGLIVSIEGGEEEAPETEEARETEAVEEEMEKEEKEEKEDVVLSLQEEVDLRITELEKKFENFSKLEEGFNTLLDKVEKLVNSHGDNVEEMKKIITKEIEEFKNEASTESLNKEIKKDKIKKEEKESVYEKLSAIYKK